MFGVPVSRIAGVEVAVLTEKLNPLTLLVAETEVTVPPPAGVAHVPSPRQKVDDDALVPSLRFDIGKLPVTSEARLIFATVLNTPPVAFTQPDEVNRPICFPVVLEKIAAWPTTEVEVSLVTSLELEPPGAKTEHFHALPTRNA